MKKLTSMLLICVMVFSAFNGVHALNNTTNITGGITNITNNNTFISNNTANSQNSSVIYVSEDGNDENDGSSLKKVKKRYKMQ